jgi:hypothetical protein
VVETSDTGKASKVGRRFFQASSGGFACTTVDEGVQSANELRIKLFVFGVFRWSDRAAF